MLSNLPPFEVFGQPFPTRLGRSLLAAKFRINGAVIAVATNHLESYPKDSVYRQQQMSIAEKVLTHKSNDGAFLMGDCKRC